jgi:hypothetical protein
VPFRRAVALHAADKDLAARLQWVNEYLGLDPTRDRLNASERYRRTQRLVDLMVAAVNSCLDRNQTPTPDPVQKLLDAADKQLTARRRVANVDQASDDSLALSEQLWKAKQAACPEAPGTGTPLAALMTRLTQPQTPANNN